MKIISVVLLLLFIHLHSHAQVTDSIPARDTNSIKTENLPVLADTTQYNDTAITKTAAGEDTAVRKKVHSPKRATIYSAILPGLGQIYNKKYWKVPIVYAGVGIPAAIFFYNRNQYNAARYALSIVANNKFDDEEALKKVDPQLRPFVVPDGANQLINYRNEVRRNLDYSVLVTLIMWGLNVVDATVDAHLKGFDVGDELSMKLQPAIIPGTMVPGISFVVNFK